jgi:hypothetical protein
MAAITPSVAGAAITYQAAAGGGDYYVNTGRQMLHVRNGGGSPITVSIARVSACNQGTVHAADTVVIPNAEDRLVAAKDPVVYNDANGRVQITYTGVTTVTVGVIS